MNPVNSSTSVSIKPIAEVAGVYTHTTSKLIQNQADLVSNMLTCCLTNAKSAIELKNSADYLCAQQDAVNNLRQMCADTAQKHFTALQEANEEILTLVQSNFSVLPSVMKPSEVNVSL